MRYLDSENGLPGVYATDGTYQTAVWKSPKMFFKNERKFVLLVILFRYNGKLPYGEEDIDSTARASETPLGSIKLFVDDRQAKIKEANINFNVSADGEYRYSQVLNVRGRKFAFELDITAGKYWSFMGFELKHIDKGRKSYG